MATCNECRKSVPFYNIIGGVCSECLYKRKKADLEGAEQVVVIDPVAPSISEDDLTAIILSTEAAPDLKVAQRLDIISAEFAVGMGLLTDIFNAWRDVFGGRSKSYQNALKDARRAVLHELRREAHLVGADAVLGVSLDYSEISGGGKSMLFLVASGTAVKLAPTH